LKRNFQNGGNLCRIKYFFIIRKNGVFLFRHLFYSLQKNWSPEEQALIILHPKLGQMVNGIVLPIKKVFGLVDSKISVEIKDEGRKLQGRLVAVDEYLNIHMDETIEFVDNQRGRSLGTVVIRGNNILTIAPVI
jgi:small nuclear ribonucleoprotein (snRNP)-like protein